MIWIRIAFGIVASCYLLHGKNNFFCPQIQDDEIPDTEEPKKQMDDYKDTEVSAERFSREMASQLNPTPNQEV